MLSAGPDRRVAYAVLLAAVVVAAGSVASDPAGRLLGLPAALALTAVGLRDLLLRPVLSADDAGLTVVVGLRRRRVGWADVERLRVVTDRRTPMLEIDLGSTLVVLTRARLGRPPDVVLSELSALQR